MGIHSRTVTEPSGDTLDTLWYCSQACYAASFADDSAGDDTAEEGGAHPCGEESDSPDFCATCGAPVGNPLTSEGWDYAQELVSDWHADPETRAALLAEYHLHDIRTRGAAVRFTDGEHTLTMAPMGPDYVNRTRDIGRTVWHYRLRQHGRLIFDGADFSTPGASWSHNDPVRAVAGLLGFLTLRPGDTDADYFDYYTPEQLDWRDQEAEYLSTVPHDLETAGGRR